MRNWFGKISARWSKRENRLIFIAPILSLAAVMIGLIVSQFERLSETIIALLIILPMATLMFTLVAQVWKLTAKSALQTPRQLARAQAGALKKRS